MGAEVIKIDPPAGKATANSFYDNVTPEYTAAMRGKRSVIMDIEQPANKPFLDGLIKISDGIVESSAPGYMKKFGFSYEDAAALKSDICYLSITGFGQYGPYAQRPYNDTVIQALSGLMSITGEPEGRPVKAGTDLAEEFAGLFSAVGMVAMLRHQLRTGGGQHLDLAQLDCMIPPLENAFINYLATGKVPGKLGNRHRVDVPFQDFPTKNGDLLITVNRDNTFAALCRVLDCPQFIVHPRYADCESRRVNADEVVAQLAAEQVYGIYVNCRMRLRKPAFRIRRSIQSTRRFRPDRYERAV
jgi:crotonobetainyl-CoA:carnitine CoA-transferase CaiB-like acyl-CoA transferase